MFINRDDHEKITFSPNARVALFHQAHQIVLLSNKHAVYDKITLSGYKVPENKILFNTRSF
ncbi:hypothetical protein [Dictyobacter kobayashii]|uniref:Uncharacterized protein n=1 Tax=Dictyobacter kobayashii TaxID=2014872 RepID=A0A402AEH5_9CHLR|nr:hypothetical protein [Dictyobacter kobayashii]GCE17518.1 hypothetical protein KDK_13180 [Dictyobacter kobayashii]